jgi:hypothetical protein
MCPLYLVNREFSKHDHVSFKSQVDSCVLEPFKLIHSNVQGSISVDSNKFHSL